MRICLVRSIDRGRTTLLTADNTPLDYKFFLLQGHTSTCLYYVYQIWKLQLKITVWVYFKKKVIRWSTGSL